MINLEMLNAVAADWASHVLGALADSTLILVVAAAIWWLVRQRATAQFGYWLFLLVLARLLVPIELTVPAWIVPLAPKHLLNWTADRVLPRSDATSRQESPPARYLPLQHRPYNDASAPLAYQTPYSQWQRPIETSSAAAPAAPIVAAPGSVMASVHPSRWAQLTWQSVLMLGWLLAAGALLVRLVALQRRTRRLIANGSPLDPTDLPVDLQVLATAAGLPSAPAILVTDVASPAVCGVFRPRLLVPPDLLRFAPRQVTWILLHELAHIQRRDILVALGQRLLQAFYFFHPGVWAANWAIDQLREYACDDAALAACGASRRDCGEGFLNVALRASGHPMLAATSTGLLNNSGFIRRRLVRILDSNRKISASLSAGAIGLLVTLAAVMIPNVRAATAEEEAATRTIVAPVAEATDGAATSGQTAAPSPAAQEGAVGSPNLTWQKFPAEFADYYTTQRLLTSPTEPQPFCKSRKPLLIDGAKSSFRMQAVLDESGGTGTGYDTLYVDMNGTGDFTSGPAYRISPTDRQSGLEGNPLVSYFENVHIPRDLSQDQSAHVQMFVEHDPSAKFGAEYVLNLIPAQWAVGTIEVNGQSVPVGMVDGTFNDSVVNRRGMTPWYINQMSPGDDAGVLKSDYIVIGKPGETSLQPGDPNGWLGKTGSARSLNTQYLVTDQGLFEIQADQNDQGVNLQLVPVDSVPTATVDLSQVPHNGRLALFGRNACVLLENPGTSVQVPGDTYYVPAFGAFTLDAPAGGQVKLTPPADLDLSAPAGFNSLADRDQRIFTMEPPGGALGTPEAVRWSQPQADPFAFSNRRQNWRKVALQVVGGGDRTPVAGASVSVDTYSGAGWSGGGSRKFLTDARGQCTIRVPGANLQYLMAVVEAAGYVPTRRQWSPRGNEAIPGQYTWVLEKGTAIGGVVRDERGRPIGGVQVTLGAQSGDFQADQPYPALETLTIQTDKQGKWRCDAAPARIRQVQVGLKHPDYISDESVGRSMPIDALRKMTVELVMKQGITLTGKVLGPKNKPIEDAIINWGNYNAVKTDRQGRFRVVNLAEGEMVVTARAAGCAPDQKKILIEQGIRPMEFTLGAGNTIKGRVIDQMGNPVAMAEVFLQSWRGSNSIFWYTNTDALGRFAWTEAPDDEVVFSINKDGYMPLQQCKLTADRQEQVLTIWTKTTLPLQAALTPSLGTGKTAAKTADSQPVTTQPVAGK